MCGRSKGWTIPPTPRRSPRSRPRPCIVLGRGADTEAVDRWLRAGAAAPGYAGFAIGRSIWWGAMRLFFDERLAEDAREAATERIATNYRRCIDVYESAGDTVRRVRTVTTIAGRWVRPRVAIQGLFVLFGFGIAAFFPFLGIYLRGYHGLNESQIGLAIAAMALARLIANPLWGHFADTRIGRLTALQLGVGGSALAAVGFNLVDPLWAVLVRLVHPRRVHGGVRPQRRCDRPGAPG